MLKGNDAVALLYYRAMHGRLVLEPLCIFCGIDLPCNKEDPEEVLGLHRAHMKYCQGGKATTNIEPKIAEWLRRHKAARYVCVFCGETLRQKRRAAKDSIDSMRQHVRSCAKQHNTLTGSFANLLMGIYA